MRTRDALNMGGPAEALNMGDPMNSANTIVRDGLSWTARQGHLT